ncbi:MAG: hypothetical protein H6841_11535 [Planctomycetes bacterium]|nr:hypothetical protein [Planctomycetota bacterium]MCB9935081.1 hypothetical protein [Planctomycetota bacterium]
MKKLLIVLLLAAPAFAVFGCQQDASVQGDIANLKQQVAALQNENELLRSQIGGMPSADGGQSNDLGTLLARLERQERELEAANSRLADLEKKPEMVAAKKAEGEVEGEVAVDDAEYEKFKAMAERDRAERDAERQKQREERQAQQMAEAKKMAEKYGFEFDENDPRGSIMKIMSDPAQRAKAMEAMRTEMTERRLAPLNLDDYQKQEVLRIEDDTRKKIRETMTNARENGATQEEIQQQVKQLQDDQKAQLGSVLTPEQMKQYEESGAGMGGMMPNPEDLGRMIPGFGGGGGWGGGGR